MAPDFRAYPNPAAAGGTIRLEGLPGSVERWSLLNLQGITIASGLLQEQRAAEIYLPNLAPGTYLLSLSGEEAQYQLSWLIR